MGRCSSRLRWCRKSEKNVSRIRAQTRQKDFVVDRLSLIGTDICQVFSTGPLKTGIPLLS